VWVRDNRLRFSISRIPEGLDPNDYPGGFPFVGLRVGSDTFEIRGRESNHSNEYCLENRDFSPTCQSLFQSCWDFFVPPLILAGKDVAFKYHRYSKFRGQLSMDSLERDFERAVRFYVEENKTRGFPFVRVIDSGGDVELPADWWVWVLEFYPGEGRALVINVEKFHDFLPVAALDVSVDYLESRFPATPNYIMIPSRSLPRDVIPRSLCD
jgi:hypothetical protein